MHENNMVRNWKKKGDGSRKTINVGKRGDPFRDLVDRHIGKFESVTDFFRDCAMLMYSNDSGYKERKILMLKHQFVKAHNDAKLAVGERQRIKKALKEAGASDEEIGLLWEL